MGFQSVSRKCLRETVGQHLCSWHILWCNNPSCNEVPYVMIAYVNCFGSSMVFWVSHDSETGLVVATQPHGTIFQQAVLLLGIAAQLPKPCCFLGRFTVRNVLRLCSGRCHERLLFACPSNGAIGQYEQAPGSAFPAWVFREVTVRAASQPISTLAIMELGLYSSFQIPKHPLSSNPMLLCRVSIELGQPSH